MSKRIFHLICSMLIFASFIYVIIPQFASAATSCDPPEYFSTSFLGFNAWYSGLRKKHANGAIGESVCPEEFSEQSLSGTVIRIVLNVLGDLMFAAGILAVGFVIYSGFMLITAGGEVGKGKK